MNKVFCSNCNKKVSYHVIKEVMREYKGYQIDIVLNIGVCDICNEKIYISELEKQNLKNIYDTYRKMAGLITPEDIIEFRNRYNISQKELISILGWGHMTINRYERGSLPSQNHDEVLRLIIKNEKCFIDKVEDAYRKNRISEKIYSKIIRD